MFNVSPPAFVFPFFFFNDTATTEIYTLSLHDALPIYVGDAELEERGALDDALSASRILFTGQLDDEAAAPLDLHDGLAGAELVDPCPHHFLGALNGVGAVGHGPLRLVDFERQVNPALEIEAKIDRHAPDRGVLHTTGHRVAHPLGDVAGDQLPHRQHEKRADGEQSCADRAHIRVSTP